MNLLYPRLMGTTMVAVGMVGGCQAPTLKTPAGMVLIPAGSFVMGAAPDAGLHFADAKPRHEVHVAAFWMDRHEVTNDEFAMFVQATGYKTVAERVPDKAEIMRKTRPGSPEPDAAWLVPGSVVFVPPKEPIDWRQQSLHSWWQFVPGACWKHPEGPGSDTTGRGKHPVVHVCWEDAVAYARWCGKRLPTEAEWEYAARGGLDQQEYVWGSEPPGTGGRWKCNIWQGEFPHHNTLEDGYLRTAPVGSYDPNGYGLYDMAGNVWEWCQDWYQPEYHRNSPRENPKGPSFGFDPADYMIPKRVQRGGSFLCSDEFCSRYKPAGRGKGEPLTGLSHVGFRCVRDLK